MAIETPKEQPKVETPPPSDYDAMATVFDGLFTPEPSVEDDPAFSTKEVDKAAVETPEAKVAREAAEAAEAAETPEAKAAREAAEAAAATKTPEEIEAEAAAAAAVETPEEKAAKEAAAKKPEETDWKAKFEALEAERAAPEKKEPAKAESEKEEPPPKIYSTEEEEFLTAYAENWPDVAKGEALRRRAEYGRLVDHIFNEFNRVYAPLIERGALAADQVAETSALTIIQGAHNDYDDKMYGEVISWANDLTGTRKKIAQGIIEEGDPGEVIELITEFKSATGRKPRVVADGGTPPPVTPAAPAAATPLLSAAAKKAAKALGVVDSKRSAPTTSPADPSDFDAAWDEAVGAK